MGFLESIGLSRKKRKPFHVNVDKKKAEQEQKSTWRKVLPKILISLGFLTLVIALYPRTTVHEFSYSIGEPWRDDDVTAPFTFSLQKSEEQIQQEEEEIRETTPPVFYFDQDAEARMTGRLNSIFDDIEEVAEYYADWRVAQHLEDPDAEADSLRFAEARGQLDIDLDDGDWQPLLQSQARYEISKAEGDSPDDPVISQLRLKSEELLSRALRDGVLDTDKDDIDTGEVTIRDEADLTERTVDINNVFDVESALDHAESDFTNTFDDETGKTAKRIFAHILEPTLAYDENASIAAIDEALEDISHTKGAISEGQVIIRRGDIVTEDRYNELQSLAQARADRATDLELWQQYIGESVIVIAVFLVFFMYLYLYRRLIYDNIPLFLLVFLVMGVIVAISATVAQVGDISPYVIPVALGPVILTIIFDSRVGLMTTITLAILTGMMFGNNFEFIVATIAASSMGVYSVRDIKNRSQLYLTTPGIILLSYLVVLLGFTLTRVGGWDLFFENAQFLLINAVGIWLTYPLILVIEKVFKVTTDVTLLELSDTNQPILKKLMIEAPGSFHHSLQVANLAETAASAIGANSLMCRVGGLYHDIGKLNKPSYFVENQTADNEHDKQTPRMSAQIIKDHVTKGDQMARDLELPNVIIDFIRTHHGTTLIKYFYQKALEQSTTNKEIREEDFKYDGPIPNSKETGILLLADCIEASSRSMKEPSYQKLEKLVNRMVEERVDEGQLNNTPLTFQELRIIKENFLKILVGMYHGRVKYPGQEETEAKEQKEVEAENQAEASENVNPSEI